MFRIVLLALAAVSISVFAREKCYPRGDLASPDDFTRYMIRVADYVGQPPRQQVDEMSPEMQNRYAATGKIRCMGAAGTPWAGKPVYGSAQLTFKDNLITTAGHNFIYNESANPPGSGPPVCRPMTDPKTCRFLIGEQEIPLDHVVENGIKCPTEPHVESDWAVVKLSKHLTDVKFYRVDENESRNLEQGDQVVTIAHSADFHSKSVYESGPKHFGQCTVLRTYGMDSTVGVSTACGASYGASGGSLLTPGADPVLLGVVVEAKESVAEIKHAFSAGTPNVKTWQPDGNGTYYVTLQGAFLRALERGASE